MCAVRCPAGIPFTDVMYELKRLGVKYDIYPKDATNAVMARSFVRAIDRYGRNAEAELIRDYYLRTNPFKIISQLKLASKLFFTGRIKLRSEKIKGLDGLRKMMAAVEKEDAV
jgi:hypothetical protein